MKKSIVSFFIVSLFSLNILNAQSNYIDRDEITRNSNTNGQDTEVVSDDIDKLIIGTWAGEDKGDIGFIDFDQYGFASFVFEGDTMGGSSYYVDGILTSMEYLVTTGYSDFDYIDFVMYAKNDETVLSTLPGIFKFIGDDEIYLCVNFEGSERPSYFKEEDSVTFLRVR